MEKLREATLKRFTDLAREIELTKANSEIIRRIIDEEEVGGEGAALIAEARASLLNLLETAGLLEAAIATLLEGVADPSDKKKTN